MSMASNPALKVARLPEPGRNVITIASGKGGVGKTWLSICVAHAMARKGRNILLFDGDLGLANIDIQLGLMPERDLASVVSGKLTLERSVIELDDLGFSVIAGRSGSGSLALLPPPRLTALRDGLLAFGRAYDNLIIDLGAGVDRTVQALTPPNGACLVVTSDEPTALTDAYAFIKLTLGDRKSADLRVVVNLAGSKSDGERTYETLAKACRSFLKFDPPLAGIIRRDAKVRESIKHQTSLFTRYPNCEAAMDVERIVQSLLGKR